MSEPTHIRECIPRALADLLGGKLPCIVVDTREQTPLVIDSFPVVTEGLPVGDYGLQNFSTWENPRFIIERKSLPDLIGSLTSGRARFMREVELLRRFEFAAIVIEGNQSDVEAGEYRSTATPESILQSLYAIEVRTNVHVKWCGDRRGASAAVQSLARQFVRGVVKDIRRLAAVAA